MEAWLGALLGVVVVSLVSLVGALALPGLHNHRFLLALVASAAGTLVGDAFLHLLPEATLGWAAPDLPTMGLWVLSGFVAFFVLEVALRSRHHHAELAGEGHHAHEGEAIAPFAWTNLIGDALHNFLDGAVIATAFLVDTGLGLATTVAVIVHEVPQELGDFAVLLRAGMSRKKALLFNFGSALLAVLGAVVVLAVRPPEGTLETYGLPFIAGAFLYIAAADLVPELHHHSRGRDAVLILGAFVFGIGIMYGLLRLEQTGVLEWLAG